MKKHHAKVPFTEAHPDTLALHCSDGRFTHAVDSLVTSLGHPTYDIMAMPGGAALLDISSASMIEVEATRAGTSFLIQGHKIKNAFLLAHAGCGFYRRRYAGLTIEKIAERQTRDIKAAAAWLGKTHPGVKLYAFLAFPDKAKGHVEFSPIDISDVSAFAHI